jgi:uncharacterized protein YdiU (UPF0061 family)
MSALGVPTSRSLSLFASTSETVMRPWYAEGWHACLGAQAKDDLNTLMATMRRMNPRYAWRERLVAPAYEAAEQGDYAQVRALQALFNAPYVDQDGELAAQSDRKRPSAYERRGSVAHYSCSS